MRTNLPRPRPDVDALEALLEDADELLAWSRDSLSTVVPAWPRPQAPGPTATPTRSNLGPLPSAWPPGDDDA